MSNTAIVSSVLSKHNVPYIVTYAADLSSIQDNIPETIDVAGIARPTHNSRGQLIHPTLDGIKNFWNWFGSSKIVDEHGRPAVYYHGTSKDVSSFVPNDALGGLIFAAPTAKEAAVFAGNNLGSNVMPVYIKASKPYPRGCLASDEVRTAAKAKSLGYDAIYVHDTIADPYNIGVFSPNQIKSALGNNGKFSSNATEVTASVPLTSAKLRRLINSKQAYAILDSTVGGTWLEGGCALLAVALSDLGYGELFVLVGKSRGSTITQVQHWLVKTPSGTYLDGDGVSSERSLLRRWHNDEDIENIQLRPATSADKKGATWESATYTDALAKLKDLLAPLSANEVTASSIRDVRVMDLKDLPVGDNIYYRGCSPTELSLWLSGKHPNSNADLMPLDIEVIRHALPSDIDIHDEDAVDTWVQDIVPWYDNTRSSILGGLNVATSADNASGYGPCVLALRVTGDDSIAEFSSDYVFIKSSLSCALIAYYKDHQGGSHTIVSSATSHKIPSLDELDEAERAEFDRWSLAGLIRDDSGKPLLLFHGGNEELRDDDWWTPDLRNTREFGYITHCAYLRMLHPATEDDLVDIYNDTFGTDLGWVEIEDETDTTPADFLEQNHIYFDAVRKKHDGFIIFDNSLEHPDLAYRVFDVDTDAWVLGTVS